MIRKGSLLGIGIFLLLAFPGWIHAQNSFNWPQITKDNKPWTRWWWMGNAIDTAGLAHNLTAFQKAGIGGVEITPIYGVDGFEKQSLGFLSPEWMKMLGFTMAKAGELGMGVDMNNGTGWPFGGPQISADDAASRVIFQQYQADGGGNFDTVIVVKDRRQAPVAKLQRLMAYSDKGKILDLTAKIDKNGRINWKTPQGKWNLIAVFNGKTLQKVKRSSPGGEGLVMNPFSSHALKSYLASFTDAFTKAGAASPHAFFDDSYEIYGADWTEDLFSEFKKRRGYALEDYLPSLLGEGNKDTVVRVITDYRQTLSDVLLDGFASDWNRWAHQMGSLTRFQAHGAPGNLLDLYASADIPEIESFGSSHFNVPGLPEDSLGDRPGRLDPLLLKFASSAAHVTGKPFVSSETFTWLGEHFRVALSQCKPLLDEMLLSGINYVFFHGSPYSPKNAPWPGWQFYASVNFTPYNTFWKAMPAFNEYIARAQSFLQQGVPDNEVLLYWPASDVWATNTNTLLYQLTIHNAEQWLSPTPFHQVAEKLTDLGYSMDYISDLQLQQVSANSGDLETKGGKYKVLVVPPAKYMPLETLRKIKKLAEDGAQVIFAGALPESVPGMSDLANREKEFKEIKAFMENDMAQADINKKQVGKGNIFVGQDLQRMMFGAGLMPSGFSDADLQFIRRKDADGFIYFVSNINNRPVNQWISLSKKLSSAVFYDPYTGNSGKARLKDNEIRGRATTSSVYLQLEPGQSIIIRGYDAKDVEGNTWKYIGAAGDPVDLSTSWKMNFEEGAPVINQNYSLDRLKSWTLLGESAKVFAGTGKYSLTFDLPENVDAQNWLLDLGQVNFSADVTINGRKVASLWAVPFKLEVGAYLQPGKNTLEVAVTNIGANRIADYDRKGINWKIFKDINVVNMDYKPFDASSWGLVPSGLMGPVTLTPFQTKVQF